MNKIIIIISLCILKMCASHDSRIIPELEENLFHAINGRLQDVVNKLFTMLKLDRHFTEKHENKLLLALHAGLKRPSEHKYIIFKDVSNTSKLDPKFELQKNSSLFKLDKPIEEIFKEDFNLTDYSRKTINIESTVESVEVPKNSEERVILLREYLNNQNVALAEVNPYENNKRMYETRRRRFGMPRRRNLKVWKQENSTEFSNDDLLDTRRVFNGIPARIKKYPFVASIHLRGEFVCTGSIISRDLVITAASCLQPAYFNPKFLHENPNSVVVRVGSDYPDRLGELILVVNMYFNPTYDTATLSNNLVIVRIKKQLHLRKKSNKIRRIDYQRMEGRLPDSIQNILLLGWGDKDTQSSTDENQNNELSLSHLNLYKIEECIDIYTKKYVTEKNFCAGVAGKEAGACQRDVGGPGIVSSVLVGVVSFGPPVCGTADAPTVFTNLGHHVQWIDSVVTGVKGAAGWTARSARPSWQSLHTWHQAKWQEPLQWKHSRLKVSTTTREKQESLYSCIAAIIGLPRSLIRSQVTNKSTLFFSPTTTRRHSTSMSINTATQKSSSKTTKFTTLIQKENTKKPQSRFPKAVKILTNVLRFMSGSLGLYTTPADGGFEWYADDNFETQPDTHLWKDTAIIPNRHPLSNQSIFITESDTPFQTEPIITTLYTTKTYEETVFPEYGKSFETTTTDISFPKSPELFTLSVTDTPTTIKTKKVKLRPRITTKKTLDYLILSKEIPDPVMRFVDNLEQIKRSKISESDNYESDEKLVTKHVTPITSRSHSKPPLPMTMRFPPNILANAFPFAMDQMIVDFTQQFQIPRRDPVRYPKFPHNSIINPEQLLIKNFVRNQLSPMSSKLGLYDVNNFEEGAEDFLTKNFLAGHLLPMDANIGRMPAMFNLPDFPQNHFFGPVPYPVPSLNNRDIHFEEQVEKYLGNEHKADTADLSDEFVLLLLKQTTTRKKRFGFAVTDKIEGYGKDDIANYVMKSVHIPVSTTSKIQPFRTRSTWQRQKNETDDGESFLASQKTNKYKHEVNKLKNIQNLVINRGPKSASSSKNEQFYKINEGKESRSSTRKWNLYEIQESVEKHKALNKIKKKLRYQESPLRDEKRSTMYLEKITAQKGQKTQLAKEKKLYLQNEKDKHQFDKKRNSKSVLLPTTKLDKFSNEVDNSASKHSTSREPDIQTLKTASTKLFPKKKKTTTETIIHITAPLLDDYEKRRFRAQLRTGKSQSEVSSVDSQELIHNLTGKFRKQIQTDTQNVYYATSLEDTNGTQYEEETNEIIKEYDKNSLKPTEVNAMLNGRRSFLDYIDLT